MARICVRMDRVTDASPGFVIELLVQVERRFDGCIKFPTFQRTHDCIGLINRPLIWFSLWNGDPGFADPVIPQKVCYLTAILT